MARLGSSIISARSVARNWFASWTARLPRKAPFAWSICCTLYKVLPRDGKTDRVVWVIIASHLQSIDNSASILYDVRSGREREGFCLDRIDSGIIGSRLSRAVVHRQRRVHDRGKPRPYGVWSSGEDFAKGTHRKAGVRVHLSKVWEIRRHTVGRLWLTGLNCPNWAHTFWATLWFENEDSIQSPSALLCCMHREAWCDRWKVRSRIIPDNMHSVIPVLCRGFARTRGTGVWHREMGSLLERRWFSFSLFGHAHCQTINGAVCWPGG